MEFEHLEIEQHDHVSVLWLNRPEKLNAFSGDLWEDIPVAIESLDADSSVRAVVVAGRGPAFTVGIDLTFLPTLMPQTADPDDRAEELYPVIRRLQRTNTVLAECSKPVIAAVHGYCLGQGMNLMTACDVRLASRDAVFAVRETKLAITADVGVLQRLPGIVGSGRAAEMALTGRDYSADEALEMGLVSHIYADAQGVQDAAIALAAEMAENSPLALRGVKAVLRAGQGRTIEDGLDYVARWNAQHLISNDLFEAISAASERRPPRFHGD